MSAYVLVGSRDPLESAAGRRVYELAAALADHGEDVAVFLVQNAVLPARQGSSAAPDLAALASKTTVFADEFSLRQRAIRADELVADVRPAPIDDLVELVVGGQRKAIWL